MKLIAAISRNRFFEVFAFHDGVVIVEDYDEDDNCDDVGDSGIDRCFYGIILNRKTCVVCFCVQKIAIFTL